MGLCKCPKRQVTNQFCFEHRVNVCENCMVNSHPKCIVQSYLQWLKDSDYDASCPLCKNSLENDECVRLICYHVFHCSCLNDRQSALPANTAPGGHTCPTCYDQIFPPSNLISPVADVLRSRLRQTNWGRDELGLVLLPDELAQPVPNQQTPQNNSNKNASIKNKSSAVNSNSHEQPKQQHSVLSIEPPVPTYFPAASSRRPLLHRESPIGGSDSDDNKYKRRTPAEIFNRWSRRFYAPTSRPPWRRTWFAVLSAIVLFVLVIWIMATLGRRSPDNDDYFDAAESLHQ